MGTPPWFGLALGLVVAALAVRGLWAHTPHRASHYIFLGLGTLSMFLALLEILH